MRYETRLAPARLPLPPTHTDPRGARAMPISTTITASDLGALFSLPSSALDRTTPETMGSARRPPPDRASRTTPTAPPGYGRRAADAWRPRTHADFLDGGAYPEIDVVQLPAGLGWGANAPASDHPDRAWASPPAALDVNFATLQICAARRALRLDRDSSVSSADARGARVPSPPRRTTAEYDTVVAYFARVFRSENEGENTRARDGTFGGSIDASSCAYANTLLDAHPNARSPLRVRDVQPNAVAGLVLEPPAHGVPTIVSDAGRDWRQGASWGFDGLAARLGDEMVTCNDRAPARRADATSAHGKQRTCALPVREYLEYARGRPGSDDPDAMARADAPFYLNGWRAFEASEASEASESVASRAFPPPYFTSAMDHTRAIVEETHRRLLPRAPAGSAEATADGLDAALGKMFVGPAGTVTRMHQDAGEAHAWLAQVVGRKLFVCCPPDDAPALRVIEGETETAQSAVDPLDLSRDARVASAKFWTEARPVVFTLEPGEAAVIPRGWWHYAVAIDHGWTVMRNFYHAGTNAAALVRAIAGKLDREHPRRS